MLNSKFLLGLVIVCILAASIEAKKSKKSKESKRSKESKGSSSEEDVCDYVKGSYFNGPVFASFESCKLGSCCLVCQANPLCYSYTYNPRTQICFLKGEHSQRFFDSRGK